MNKQTLLTWMQDPGTLTSGDAKKLEELSKEHPYFSIAYALNARLKHAEKSPDAKKALGQAALYTADRHVLKQLVIGQSVPTTSPTRKEEANAAQVPEASPKPETKDAPPLAEKKAAEEAPAIRRIVFEDESTPTPSHLEDSFYQEVEENLKSLTAQKKALNMWIRLHDEDDPTASEVSADPAPWEHMETPGTQSESIADPEEELPTEEEAKPSSSEPEAPEAKEETEDIPEPEKPASTPPPLPPEATATPPPLPTEEPTPPPIPKQETGATPPPLPTEETTPKPPEAPKGEELLRGLEERSILEASTDWQREQTEMINRFLTEEPQLRQKGNRDSANSNEPQEDLSLKSQVFGDNIISENLARIMTKQGKTDKAIEIYRKLIWKFPQKKGYFADLIEKLKESE